MLYLHIPFCKTRCIYCDFFSTTQGPKLRSAYVQALCAELRLRSGEWSESGRGSIRSIYFGGGTPSQLSASELADIMGTIRSHYPVAPDAEITLEANPDDITAHFVEALVTLGFNRLSLGTQSFNDATLRLLHRRHTAVQATEAVETARSEGIGNISIDLMFGLPGQSLTDWESDLNRTLSLPITHFSAYALTIEPTAPISRMIQEGRIAPADEDTYVQEFEMLMNAASNHGFEHYEISNYARPGFRSRHNSGYWNSTPYIGLGPGAHSFDGKNRRQNLTDLTAYVQAAGHAPHSTEQLSPEERFNEHVFTALRTADGLPTTGLSSTFPAEWTGQLLRAARPHLEGGNLTLSAGGRLTLTRRGILVSDDVMSDLMRV